MGQYITTAPTLRSLFWIWPPHPGLQILRHGDTTIEVTEMVCPPNPFPLNYLTDLMPTPTAPLGTTSPTDGMPQASIANSLHPSFPHKKLTPQKTGLVSKNYGYIIPMLIILTYLLPGAAAMPRNPTQAITNPCASTH